MNKKTIKNSIREIYRTDFVYSVPNYEVIKEKNELIIRKYSLDKQKELVVKYNDLENSVKLQFTKNVNKKKELENLIDSFKKNKKKSKRNFKIKTISAFLLTTTLTAVTSYQNVSETTQNYEIEIQNILTNYSTNIENLEKQLSQIHSEIPEPSINFENYPEIKNSFNNLENILNNIERENLNPNLRNKYYNYLPLLRQRINNTYQNLFINWDEIQNNNILNFEESPYFIASIIQKETNWFNFSAGYSGETGLGQQMPFVLSDEQNLNQEYQNLLEQNLIQKLRTTNFWGLRTGFEVLIDTLIEIENNNEILFDYNTLIQIDSRLDYERQIEIITNTLSNKTSPNTNLPTLAAIYNGGFRGHTRQRPQNYSGEVIGYMQTLLEYQEEFEEIINNTTAQQREEIRNQYIQDNANYFNQIMNRARIINDLDFYKNRLEDHKNEYRQHLINFTNPNTNINQLLNEIKIDNDIIEELL